VRTRTLAERLAEGPIPAAEALGFALQLAGALRGIHDEGRVYGSLSPLTIALDNNSAELLPSIVGVGGTASYVAPELLAGGMPDSRSDIFSFGAVVYEMLTGRRAFEGLDRSNPPQSGSPGVDCFVRGCVAADPNARVQNLRRVMMELRLLHAAARRADTPTGARGLPRTSVRAEVHALESQFRARQREQQKTVAELQHFVTEAIDKLRVQLASVSAQLSAPRDSAKVDLGLLATLERLRLGENIVADAADCRPVEAERKSSAAAMSRIATALKKAAGLSDRQALVYLRKIANVARGRISHWVRPPERIPQRAAAVGEDAALTAFGTPFNGRPVTRHMPAPVDARISQCEDELRWHRRSWLLLAATIVLAGWTSAWTPFHPVRTNGIARADSPTKQPIGSAAISPKLVTQRKSAKMLIAPGPIPAVPRFLLTAHGGPDAPLAASVAINEIVTEIAARESLPPQLLHAIIRVESNYNPNIVSPSGAQGLMQLTPEIAQRFGVTDAFSPADNIQGGAKYLRYLLGLYDGDLVRTVAAYNAGISAVAKYGGVPPYPETRNYMIEVSTQLLVEVSKELRKSQREHPAFETAATQPAARSEPGNPVGTDPPYYRRTPSLLRSSLNVR